MDSEVDDLAHLAYQQRLSSGLLASFILSHCSLKSQKNFESPIFYGEGGGGGKWGYKCQLSVNILANYQLSVKFWPFCQLSFKWLLMISMYYETYLHIFDVKFCLKLSVKFEN